MLGRTGIEVSQLAIGTGTHALLRSSAQTRLGQEAFVDLLVYAHERGITWFDAADQYGSHSSDRRGSAAYRTRQGGADDKDGGAHRGWVKNDIERFRKEARYGYARRRAPPLHEASLVEPRPQARDERPLGVPVTRA